MMKRVRLDGSRWPRVVASLALVLAAAGCGGGQGARSGAPMGVAETQAPLRMPDLPPEVRLLGMEQRRLQDLFGEPAVQRNEQQAEYWRYSLGRCQLDVFLYPDPKTGRHAVAYYDVRPTGYEIAGNPSGCAEVVKQLGPSGQGDRMKDR